MTRVPPLIAVVLLAAVLATSRSSAGPDKIAFPATFASGVLYTITDRHDIKQYRELYAPADAVQAAREGKPLPGGTVLTLVQYKAQLDPQGNPLKDGRGRFLKGDLVAYTVMEKRAGWGAEYPEDLRNGEWEYAVFTADGKLNDKANYKACFQCHKPHEQQDFVISYPAMTGRKVVASSAPPAAGGVGVSISGFTFGPGSVSVPAGKAVTWTNSDESPHQIVVQGTGLRTDFVFTGQSAALTFPQAGVYSYNCALHPNMKGAVEVK
jgi:plastocyanin